MMFKHSSIVGRKDDKPGLRIRSITAFVSNYRLLFFAVAMTVFITTMIAFAAVRGNMDSDIKGGTYQHQKGISGNSVTSILSNNSGLDGSNSSASSVTKIIVNGHEVSVPKNGSVSKTYVDQNGTTHVNVQNHSSDTGSGTSVSTSTNVSTTTH